MVFAIQLLQKAFLPAVLIYLCTHMTTPTEVNLDFKIITINKFCKNAMCLQIYIILNFYKKSLFPWQLYLCTPYNHILERICILSNFG